MQATIPYLLTEGHEVIGVDNFARYGKVQRQRDYEFVEGDLTDPALAQRVAASVDGVIQAAATIYGVAGFHRYPATILSNDLVVHANVLRASVDAKVQRVAYISSSMVYERCTRIPSREGDPDEADVPRTDYGLSKLLGERMSRAFAREFDIEYVIWRPFNIVTPYEEADDEIGISHVFADFIDALCLRRENPLRIIGDGEQVRCFTWIEDVASAIGRHSFEARSRNQVFNLGNPEPITMRELARLIFRRAQDATLLPADETLDFTSLPAPDDDVRERVPDISNARNVLGWLPTVGADEALHRCVQEALKRAARDT